MRSPSTSTSVKAAAALVLLASTADVALSFAPTRLSRYGSRAAITAIPGNYQSPSSRETGAAAETSVTALPMGLRSFIKGKLGRKKGDGDDDGGKKKKSRGNKSVSSASSPPPPPSAAEFSKAVAKTAAGATLPPAPAPPAPPPLPPSPLSPGPIRQPLPEDLPPSVARGRGRAPESVQERISRVKSGRMTEKEKSAFLRAALSRPLDPRGTPIVSDSDDGDDEGGGDESKPSPFPKETLWSTVLGRGEGAGGVPSSSSSSARDSAMGGRHTPYEELDDKAKKAYYDMVTNPDRFRQYGYGSPPKRESDREEGDDGEAAGQPRTYYPSEDLIENPDEEPFESLAGEVDYAPDEHVTEEEMIPAADEDAEKKEDGQFNFFDLGSRLEAAAHAKEERDQRARAEAEARKAEEQRRLEEIRRQREEEARARMAETRRREAEIAARKAAEEEAKRKAEDERRREEEERRRVMQEAQDAYWSKKLEEEKARRARDAEGASEAERKAKERMAERAREDRAKAAEEERTRLREEERAREDPHEGEILKEAEMDELHDRERNWQITEEESAREAHKDPSRAVPDVSASTFVSEQQRKADEIARMKREQEERLRSLNSPLPAPGAAPSPRSRSQQASRSPAGSSVRQVASLASVLNQKGMATPSPSPPAPAPSPAPAPRLSLSEMTRLKKDDGGGGGPSAETAGGVSGDRGGGIPSLSEMTRLKKDDGAAAAGGPRRPVRQKLPLSGEAGASSTGRGGKPRPIRQRLPIGDDDDEADENDDLLRSGRGKTMSIGEYKSKGGGSGASGEKEDEQKRSKKWGIDIDKIL